jgi:hypothetical protein
LGFSNKFSGINYTLAKQQSPPGAWVIVWRPFITSNNIIMSKNDLFNWFDHEPIYFLDPSETSKIGAQERGKISNS